MTEDITAQYPALIGTCAWDFKLDHSEDYGVSTHNPDFQQTVKSEHFTLNSPVTDGNVSHKTPFMELNERLPNVVNMITWQDSNDAKNPSFQCSLSYNDEIFTGHGRSKQDAKHDLATKVLPIVPVPVPKPKRMKPWELHKKRPFTESDCMCDDMAVPGCDAASEASPASLRLKRFKRTKASVQSMTSQTGKTAGQLLNELLFPRGEAWKPVAEFTNIAPPDTKMHQAVFKCILTVKDQAFEGVSRCKKAAKQEAAKIALKSLFNVDVGPMEAATLANDMLGKNPVTIVNEMAVRKGWIISHDVENLNKSNTGPNLFLAHYVINGERIEGLPAAQKKEARMNAAKLVMTTFLELPMEQIEAMAKDQTLLGQKIMNVKQAPAERKHPCMLLHELCVCLGPECPKPVYTDVAEETLPETKKVQYTVQLAIGEKIYKGKRSSKKLAKLDAARAALRDMFEIDTPDPLESSAVSGLPQHVPVPVIADHVAQLVREKYADLCATYAIQPGKEMAGFVLTTGSRMENAFVVSLATGTKCISGGKISQQGQAVNDCHAEVLARRGLLLFLYKNLEMMADKYEAPNSVFEPRLGGDGYKLRDNVKLHLFITSAPCGDARIFSASDMETTELICAQVDDRPGRKNRGVLRAKVETGMGTIPIHSSNVSAVQTWDAIIGGERLLCMSCSDKVLKWNVLGVQGALLSHFVEPIYMDTIVLGSLFNFEHMIRAAFARVAPYLDVVHQTMFWVNQPLVSGVSNPESRTTMKTPGTSINWNVTRQSLELLTQDTGKDLANNPSRLCKRSLFEAFSRLHGKISAIVESKDKPTVYLKAKEQSVHYEQMKRQFYDACSIGGLGRWAKKPSEMDEFELV